MKDIQYKKFSWDTHRKNWKLKRSNVCQFELTFRCGFNCNYCYISCYNKPEYIKKELDTTQIKFVLDEVYKAGVIWLCFTGGDPLERDDFLDIYSYAKNKGFIITIFTNGYSMTKNIADYLKENPPFVIEVTLNSVTKNTHEKISGIKGSFERTMKGIDLLSERNIHLKIKTQVTKDNLEELPEIKEFIEKKGLVFRPSAFLHARLDGNLTPCSLRIKPEEVVRLNKGFNLDSIEEECLPVRSVEPVGLLGPLSPLSLLGPFKQNNEPNGRNEQNEPNGPNEPYLFSCTIGGGDGVNIDSLGNLVPCNCIREPKVNLLKENIKEARRTILDWIRSRRCITNSKCRTCSIREVCYNCPGKALLEKGSLEGEIEWFCELAQCVAGHR